MGLLAKSNALMVFAWAVLGERVVMELTVDDITDEDQEGSLAPACTADQDAAASFVQERRAERHATATCQRGSILPAQRFTGLDKKAFTVNERKCLNSGAFGDVYLTQEDGHEVALKQQDIRNEVYDGLYVFRAEVMTHKKWNTPGFVQLKDSHETANLGFIALELATGDLRVLVNNNRITVTQVNDDQMTVPQLLSDLVPSLVSMHEAGWAHRDLKLGNILVFSARRAGKQRFSAKLGDLGLACQVVQGGEEGVVKWPIPKATDLRKNIGAKVYPQCTFIGDCDSLWVYMPPEHLTHRLQNTRGACTQKFTLKSDVWMLGIMLAQLVGVAVPDYGLGWATTVANQELGRKITKTEVSKFGHVIYQKNAQNPSSLPSDSYLGYTDTRWQANGCLKSLIRGMLQPESSRLSMADVNGLLTTWTQGKAC